MPSSIDETRRDFLLKLARTAAFVPPLMATVALGDASAAVKKPKNNNGNGNGNTIGGLSPTAQVVASPTLTVKQGGAAAAAAPWSSGAPADPPPWAAPPPAGGGR